MQWDQLDENTRSRANLLLTPLTSKLNENALQIFNGAIVTTPSAIITYVNKITTQTRPVNLYIIIIRMNNHLVYFSNN
jgi:hypothetical protein